MFLPRFFLGTCLQVSRARICRVGGGWAQSAAPTLQPWYPWPCPHLSYSLLTHLAGVHTGVCEAPRAPTPCQLGHSFTRTWAYRQDGPSGPPSGIDRQGGGSDLEDPGTRPFPPPSEAGRPLAEEVSATGRGPFTLPSTPLSSPHSSRQSMPLAGHMPEQQ